VKLNRDSKEFVELLNAKGVDFVIVGAHALAFHGYPRFTGDIDILFYPTSENAERLVATLQDFGFACLGYTPADFLTPGDFIQLGVPPNRIDLLNRITAVSIEEVWSGRISGKLDGVPVFFIGREHFIKNKRATGRGKDLGDIESLGEK
jgi:predicted nucleotidyltransferase